MFRAIKLTLRVLAIIATIVATAAILYACGGTDDPTQPQGASGGASEVPKAIAPNNRKYQI